MAVYKNNLDRHISITTNLYRYNSEFDLKKKVFELEEERLVNNEYY